MISRVSKDIGKQLNIIEQIQGLLSCEPLQYICEDVDKQRYLLVVAITPLQTEVLQKEVIQNEKWNEKTPEYVLKIVHVGFCDERMYILYNFPRNLKRVRKERKLTVLERNTKTKLKEVLMDNFLPCICNELDRSDILCADILLQEVKSNLRITSIYDNAIFWDTQSANFKCFSIDLSYEVIDEKEKIAFQTEVNHRAKEIYKNLQTISIKPATTTFLRFIPNIFFNTPSMFEDKAIVFEINEWKYSLNIQVVIEKKIARLHGFIMPISYKALMQLIQYLFQEYAVVMIEYESILYNVGANMASEQALLILPDDITKLRANLSSKGRYNLKREKRLIEENIGKYEIVIYDKDNIPENVINKYFAYKKNTHNREYGVTAKEYIEQYHITDAYVMYVNDVILAMCFSCEWNENVYFENFSYCSQFKDYSLGSIMYDIYLEELVKKHKKVVFLGDGKYSYKKRYGSIYVLTHSGKIYKNRLSNIFNNLYRTSAELIKKSEVYKYLQK